MRTITVYSSSGRDGHSIITDVTTWGSLKEELSAQNVQHDKMKAVIGETKNTLESSNSVLPDGDFTLFLMPKKTKSGLFGKKKVDPSFDYKTAGYKDLRKFIVEQMETNKEKASAHFNDGKNYTNKTTEELRLLVESWLKGSSKPTKQEPAKELAKEEVPAEKKDAIGKVVETTKEIVSKKEVVKEQIAEEVEQKCVEMIRNVRDDLSSHIRMLDEFLIKHVVKQKAVLKLDEKEKKKLESQAKEIAQDFGDIQQY